MENQNLVINVGATPSAACGLTSIHTPFLVGEKISAELERKNLETFISIGDGNDIEACDVLFSISIIL